jgi:hypothetical protein
MSYLSGMRYTREPEDLLERELINHCVSHKTSFLSAKLLEEEHQLKVCQSNAGFYLGCWDPYTMEPISRDSQYFPTQLAALEALESRCWEQRMDP